MKRYAFLTVALAALFCVSCDNIGQPDISGEKPDIENPEGGSTETPTGTVKHPYVKPENRISSIVRDYGDNEQSVYTFEYDDKGEMSVMTVYEGVKSNSCTVVDVCSYNFTREGNSIRLLYKDTFADYAYDWDENGCIDIGNGKKVRADRVWAFDWLRRQVPPVGYEEGTENFICEWTGRDMVFKCPAEEFEESFTYDEDGNLLSRYESDSRNVWIAGDLKKSTCSCYIYSEGREDTFTYSDDDNVFCGVSIMSLLQCSYGFEPWGVYDEYMNDLIYGLHTRHLPVGHQLKYTLYGTEYHENDDITYERDGEGRIVKVISTPRESRRGNLQTYPETYTISYAEPFPKIAVVEPEPEPADVLDNQRLETAMTLGDYEFNTVSYHCHPCVVSTYKDGHKENSDEHYASAFGSVGFSVETCGLMMDDPRPSHSINYGWLISMDEYKGLKRRPLISDEGIREYVDSYGTKEYQKAFKLDYGAMYFFVLLCWKDNSKTSDEYDYLPLWNGSKFDFVSIEELLGEYARQYDPDKLTLTATGDWEQSDKFEYDGQVQFTFRQSLMLSLPDKTVLCEYTADDIVGVKMK